MDKKIAELKRKVQESPEDINLRIAYYMALQATGQRLPVPELPWQTAEFFTQNTNGHYTNLNGYIEYKTISGIVFVKGRIYRTYDCNETMVTIAQLPAPEFALEMQKCGRVHYSLSIVGDLKLFAPDLSDDNNNLYFNYPLGE